MERKILNFEINHFGCYTTIDGKQMLTSIANASRGQIEEFGDAFSSDAEKYFDIMPTEDKKDLSLILDKGIIRATEQELGIR